MSSNEHKNKYLLNKENKCEVPNMFDPLRLVQKNTWYRYTMLVLFNSINT